ncbi:MAG: ECF transporter S component [Oscillospiraceae bacterium]|nr:ECF transporter S component [Oscillospiraceae bacterium]
MSKELVNGNYYLISVVLILLSIVVFFFSYEKKKPQARELVTLAVMCAIAIASRAAFAMVPFFKPMSGIIMITGMAFGPGAGFLTGVVSAFVSNFIFGQGPWTPWQMFAYGVAGALAGFLCKKKVMHEEKKLRTAIFGYLIVQVIVGPILDVCSIFTMGQSVSSSYALAIFTSGFVPNLIHGIATALTLLLLAKPMMEKLNRMKVKYGMMSTDNGEWEDV